MRNTEKPTDVSRARDSQGNVDSLDTRLERSPEYLKGYRDGVRDRQVAARPHNAGDGILGALLAIALMAGVVYFGYNYATTGRLLPAGIEPSTIFPSSPEL